MCIRDRLYSTLVCTSIISLSVMLRSPAKNPVTQTSSIQKNFCFIGCFAIYSNSWIKYRYIQNMREWTFWEQRERGLPRQSSLLSPGWRYKSSPCNLWGRTPSHHQETWSRLWVGRRSWRTICCLGPAGWADRWGQGRGWNCSPCSTTNRQWLVFLLD